MTRLRNRLTYANVVATLALAIALGTGGAFAATVIISKPSQLKNGVVTNAKIKRASLKVDRLTPAARRSLRGATGPQGPKGDRGTPGAAGTSGSSAPALLLTSTVPESAGDTFIGVSGGSFGSETGAQSVVPAGTALVARDLTVQVQNAPGVGSAYAIAFRVNGTDGLACTIAGTATSCSSGTATKPLAAGDLIDYTVTATGTPPVVNRMGFGTRVVF